MVWQHMMERCYNPNCKGWRNYGARGIRVCKRWHKFINFLRDMGLRPENTTIDRRDSDNHYCKRNCRWATQLEQSQNQRYANAYVSVDLPVVCSCGIDGNPCLVHPDAHKEEVPF